MGSIAVHLEGDRRREFRRFLLYSAIGHVLLAASLLFSPGIRMEAPAGVISVELVAAPSPAPRRAPPARPKPRPAAPVPPKKVVLPAQPTEPAPVAKPKPKPEPRAKPVEKPVEKPAPRPEPVEKDYSDVLAQLREEAGEDAPEEVAPARPAALPGGGGRGRPVSPEVAAWLRKAEIHVRRAWVMPPGFRMQPLVAVVIVNLDAQGNVVGDPSVERRSGNPWYDENVVRGIRKASPLPIPPSPGEWTFVFDAEESY